MTTCCQDETNFDNRIVTVREYRTDCDFLDAEGTSEAQVRAFERFGGVQAEVLVDHQKAAVIAHPA